MPYQPGPFAQASPASIHVTPGVYDFTADAEDVAGELQTTAAGWDSMVSDIENFAAEPWDYEMVLDFPGTFTALDFGGDSMPPQGITDAVGSWFDAQSMLDAATSFAPLQAWSDPGQPFVPPDSALRLVTPQLPANQFAVGENQAVGALSNGANPWIGLFNTTRLGAQNFSVGDDFEVIALGQPGDLVSVSAVFNGQDLGSTNYGPLDAGGQMFIRGTMSPDVVGTWAEQWFLNGSLLASFNFTVSPE